MTKVYAIVYNGDPLMSGGFERRQISSERTSLPEVLGMVNSLPDKRLPTLPGLRIETREVSDWRVV